jgi:hypothetical protein
MDYRDYLKSLYFDVNSQGRLQASKNYQVVKREGKYELPRVKIKHWLQKQDVHTLHRDI